MKYRLLNILVCPVCGGNLHPTVMRERRLEEHSGNPRQPCAACFWKDQDVALPGRCTECMQREIVDGILNCACGLRYPIVNAVPVMLQDGCRLSAENEQTRQRFGYEWTRYPACFAEEEERIFFDETQFEPSELNGRLILDAGCGMGRFTRVAGSRGGEEVIGVDLSESVLSAYKLTEHMPNVHIVKADLMRLPFKDASFDSVYSLGVLHHTPSTEKTFSALVRKLKTGGLLSVWVYGTAGRYADFITNPLRPDRARFIRHALTQRVYWLLVLLRERGSNVLRRITVSMPHKVLYTFCHVLALFGKVPFFKYFTFSVHNNWRVRLLENFDWLAPPFQYHHTKEEMLAWCAKDGIAVERMLQHGFIPKVGMRGVKKRQ